MTKNKTVTISIGKDAEGKTRVSWNGMELETVDQVKFNMISHFDKPYIEVSLLVPDIDIQANIQDIQLTTDAYRRCEVCGKWIIPSIDKNLDEKVVTAEYECKKCNWKKSVEIQNWNNGIQNVESVSLDEEELNQEEIKKAL